MACFMADHYRLPLSIPGSRLRAPGSRLRARMLLCGPYYQEVPMPSHTTIRLAAAALATTLAVGCTRLSPEMQVVADAAEAMGGADRIQAVQSLTMEGSGRDLAVGGSVTPEAPPNVNLVTDYRRTLDAAAPRMRTGRPGPPSTGSRTPSWSGRTRGSTATWPTTFPPRPSRPIRPRRRSGRARTWPAIAGRSGCATRWSSSAPRSIRRRRSRTCAPRTTSRTWMWRWRRARRSRWRLTPQRSCRRT